MELTDRASILRAALRLLNTEEDDGDLIEHDGDTLEGMNLLLQQGADDAQLFMLNVGLGDHWLTTSSEITWSGSDPARYWDLPEDFLRFVGDKDFSPFHDSQGRRRWGRQVAALERWNRRGNYWYLAASAGTERVYLTLGANPIAPLVADYYREIGELTNEVTVDFPAKDRGLIPAFACVHAMEESWFPGDERAERKIERNLRRRKLNAWGRARRTLQPHEIQRGAMAGEHWL